MIRNPASEAQIGTDAICQANRPTSVHFDAGQGIDTLTRRLLERRIASEVIETFQIEPHGTGWAYPTPGGGLRWKNYDSSANPKYRWIESEKASALYFASDLSEHVAANGGVCWYVSGEPDLWAMRSAGIPHTLSGFTEKTINPQLANFLQSLGVTLLNIAPDLDQTGAAFAAKIATALKGTGIELDCRQLPAELGERGDIGKAWQRHTSRVPFERYLLGLPRWYPEPEQPKIETPLVISTGEWGDVPADYRQKIMDLLGVKKISTLGYSNKVICPFHKEEHPSADVHEIKGLYCFHEMKYYRWVEVGERLGVGSFAQTQKPIVILNTSQLAVEAQAELIRLGLTSLARLLDVLYSQGFKGSEILTLKEATSLSRNLSGHTVRRAFEQAEGRSPEGKKSRATHMQRARGSFCRVFPPHSLQQYEGEKVNKNSPHRKTGKPEGRPAKRLRVPTLEEIYAALDVKPETLQTLPDLSMKNAAQYRAEVMAAKIRRKEGGYARKQLAEPLGISTRIVREYCNRANIDVIEQFDKKPILTADDIQALPEDAQELAQWRKDGRVKGAVWLETLDGKYRFTPTQEGAARAGKNGRAFRMVRQLANHYKAR